MVQEQIRQPWILFLLSGLLHQKLIEIKIADDPDLII